MQKKFSRLVTTVVVAGGLVAAGGGAAFATEGVAPETEPTTTGEVGAAESEGEGLLGAVLDVADEIADTDEDDPSEPGDPGDPGGPTDPENPGGPTDPENPGEPGDGGGGTTPDPTPTPVPTPTPTPEPTPTPTPTPEPTPTPTPKPTPTDPTTPPTGGTGGGGQVPGDGTTEPPADSVNNPIGGQTPDLDVTTGEDGVTVDVSAVTPAGETVADPGPMAETGFESGAVAGVAGGMVLTGAALIAVRRRYQRVEA